MNYCKEFAESIANMALPKSLVFLATGKEWYVYKLVCQWKVFFDNVYYQKQKMLNDNDGLPDIHTGCKKKTERIHCCMMFALSLPKTANIFTVFACYFITKDYW